MPEGDDLRAAGEKPPCQIRSLQSWLAEVAQWLLPSSVLEYSEEVATDQATLLARLCMLASVFAIATAGSIAAEFHATMGPFGMAGLALVPMFYGALLVFARDMILRNRTRVFLHRAAVLLVLIGSTWGLLVCAVALNASHEQKDVIAALMVGLMSTVNITVPFTSAMAFLIPCGMACLIIIAVAFRPFDPYLFLFFVGYLGFSYFSAVLLNRFSLDRTVARLRLQHQDEVTRHFLRNYAETATDWSWEADKDLRFQNISPRFAAALQTIPESVRRTSLRDVAASGEVEGLDHLVKRFDNRQAFRDVVIKLQAEGETRWWSIAGQPLYDSNANFSGYRGMASDITELRRAESRVQYLAAHDSLTGLPNRACFVTELEAACLGAREGGQPSFALLLLDLDRFKEVNDTHGHPAGDGLLVVVAERLRRVVRSGDSAYRLGGDEFAVIVNLLEAADALAAAERIIKTLEEPYGVHNALLRPSVSIGLTFGPTDAREPAALMRYADLALYKAKAAGRGTWCCYKPGMETEQAEFAGIRNDLKNAAEEEFEVEYQPIIDLATRRIVAAEALVRWNHPERGRIQPSEFIPIAEESGLISAIGGLVLDRSCRAAAMWPEPVKVSVNVSASQMHDPDFLPTLDRALSASGLAADRLEMELTENVLLGDDETSFHTIEALYLRGVRVVLDDFGTGYSSLVALVRFQFSGVKIDAQFTTRMESDEKARTIIRSIGRIAEDLRVPVTAEGVETPGQLDLLRKLGISRAQGFLIGRPRSAEQMLQFIGEQSASGEVRVAEAAS